MDVPVSERARLAVVVWSVLVSQTFLYPGLEDLIVALGAPGDIQAGMWFLVAEFAAFITCAVVWGALSDVSGRRTPFIAGGAAGGAACYAVLGWLAGDVRAPFLAVLAVRTLQGAATIAAFSLSMTMLMDLGGGHGKNMGAAGIAIGSGTALGAPLGGQLYEVATPLPLYVAGALLLAVAALALVIDDRAPAGDERTLAAALTGIRRTPTLSIPYTFGFVDRMTAGFFALVGTLYFREAFGLGPGETGIMLALFFAPFALLQYPFGTLSDRIGRTVPIVAGSLLYGLAVIAVGLAQTVTGAGAGMVATGVIGALMAPATMALVTDIAATDQRGAAMGGFNVFGSLGFLTGFLVGGLVVESANYLTAFLVVGGLELAIALVALPAVRRVAPRAGEQPS